MHNAAKIEVNRIFTGRDIEAMIQKKSDCGYGEGDYDGTRKPSHGLVEELGSLLDQTQDDKQQVCREQGCCDRKLLTRVFATNPDVHLLLAGDGVVLAFQGGWRVADQAGWLQRFLGRRLHEILPSKAARRLQAVIRQVMASGVAATVEYGLATSVDKQWFEARVLPVADDRVAMIAREITRRRKAQDLRDLQHHILEMIARGESQACILRALCAAMEKRLFPGTMVTVMLVNSSRNALTVGAATNVSESALFDLEGLPIEEGAGSCGTAAYRGEAVIVEDVMTDPLWGDYRDFARTHGVGACWSMPFLSRLGIVLGTLAISHREPRKPTHEDLQGISAAVQLASITVEHVQAEQRLRQAATVFENTSEGVTITDAKANIIAVNKAFTEITGYSEHEVLGRNQRILQSHRHDRAFYDALWSALKMSGHWQGEIWNRRKNGEIYPEWRTISSVRDCTGAVVQYVSVFSDISSIKRSQEQLDHLAHHDPLTDLPNRLLLNARLTHALEHTKRSGCRVAVLFLDLDCFKNINDTLGHHVGDELLQAVARRLQAGIRGEDTVARLGGDEFVIVLENLRHSEDAAIIAQTILAAFARPFELQGREIFVTTSIGISSYPDDGKTVHELIRNADTAMYRAKEQGRNHYEFYTLELTETAFERFTLETSLRYALERDELVLYYQPQLSLEDGQVVGVEALVRWRHPQMGLVSPDKFIPLAEEIGLIGAIGDWVLRTACAQAKAWQQAGLPLFVMAVNLSGRQIIHRDLVEKVRLALETTGLAPRFLELEITESSIMGQAQKAITNMRSLKALGVTLAIDDFGTGYSSMGYLKRFCLDKLKIDRSFVRDIPTDSNDEAITRAIIAMGHNLQLKVIAEGVETQEQRTFLREHGCHEMQGYLISPPVSAECLQTFLAEHRARPAVAVV